MTDHGQTRRRLLRGLAATVLLAPLAVTGTARAEAAARLHVLKDRGCGCCAAWIEILQRDGFAVTSQDVDRSRLMQAKMAHGITPALASCHTAEVAGYVIEGHVPPADIRRLLAERPDALGLSVPGMPYGSPGMGPEARRQAYDVLLIGADGGTTVFTAYPAAGQ